MQLASKVPLKYLFAVSYKDGTTFAQNEEDISTIDPKRSAFYDVKQDEVKTFTLDDGVGNGATVDLETGFLAAFQRNKSTMGFTEDIGPKPYKLIFWRQHTHNFNIGLDELSHEVKYILGYSDADGKEHTIIVE